MKALEIQFEDHGQDFMKWTIDHHGEVINSWPFQGSTWCGVIVEEPLDLHPGGFVTYANPRLDFEVFKIKYPIEKIQEVEI